MSPEQTQNRDFSHKVKNKHLLHLVFTFAE
jgi:hypothetical protein